MLNEIVFIKNDALPDTVFSSTLDSQNSALTTIIYRSMVPDKFYSVDELRALPEVVQSGRNSAVLVGQALNTLTQHNAVTFITRLSSVTRDEDYSGAVDFAERAEPKPPFHLVWVEPDSKHGAYRSPSKRHQSFAEAKQVALCIAKGSPDSNVFIMAPVARIKTTVTVETPTVEL